MSVHVDSADREPGHCPCWSETGCIDIPMDTSVPCCYCNYNGYDETPCVAGAKRTPTDKQYRAAAVYVLAQIAAHVGEELLERDDHGEVQRPHAGGAYVQCWVRVSDALALEVE